MNKKLYILIILLALLLITGATYITNSYIKVNELRPDSNNYINATNNFNVVGNFTGNEIYGSQWFHNDSADGFNTSFSGVYSWTNISGFNSESNLKGNLSNGVTIIPTGGFFINYAGTYDVWYSVSFTGGANTEYKTIILTNGATNNNTEIHRKIGLQQDVGSVSGGGYIPLSAGDTVILAALNEVDTDHMGVHLASVKIKRVGD